MFAYGGMLQLPQSSANYLGSAIGSGLGGILAGIVVMIACCTQWYIIKTDAKLDIFTIKSFSENEMILTLNDRYLNIKMSILKRKHTDETEVIVSTVVNFNNKLGKVYMFIISPFHRLVMMRLMNNILNKNTHTGSSDDNEYGVFGSSSLIARRLVQKSLVLLTRL
ncbi:MAG: DUF2867 domain-containing protein [Tatlockia sp.]|nr:DUF2867 domain-containing protein [Tatlockia sp.]